MSSNRIAELRARLQQMGLIKPASKVVARPAKRTIEQLVPGVWREAAGMRCYYHVEAYPLEHAHGCRALREALEVAPDEWTPFLVNLEEAPLDLRQAVFIDTETSGLGQNPSTYVFMVGAGRFIGNQFIVGQYLMPDFVSEEALLELLAADLDGRRGLVTFNGRTFDWPLIEMRYMLNRRIPPDVASPHLDLLPLARRLWRRRLVSCALGSLENNLLGLQRSGADVPGYLIPQLYREYVDYGLAEPMAGVFYHNVQDVLSMVSLSAIAGQTLSALGNPDMAPAADFLALGKLFTRLGRHDDALRAMELAAGSGPDRDEQALALRQWSMLLKRLGKWQEAADIWEAQLGPDSLYAYEELAKYHEHQRRDPYAAAVVVRQALEQLAAQGAVLSRLEAQLYENSFRHRLERLERRTARQDGTR
ncbi:MAG: hypothetical protein GXY52_07780 [Chloroflexi bacterium]|nr:hypothetical protein [Chloroflexota bacterium]